MGVSPFSDMKIRGRSYRSCRSSGVTECAGTLFAEERNSGARSQNSGVPDVSEPSRLTSGSTIEFRAAESSDRSCKSYRSSGVTECEGQRYLQKTGPQNSGV